MSADSFICYCLASPVCTAISDRPKPINHVGAPYCDLSEAPPPCCRHVVRLCGPWRGRRAGFRAAWRRFRRSLSSAGLSDEHHLPHALTHDHNTTIWSRRASHTRGGVSACSCGHFEPPYVSFERWAEERQPIEAAASDFLSFHPHHTFLPTPPHLPHTPTTTSRACRATSRPALVCILSHMAVCGANCEQVRQKHLRQHAPGAAPSYRFNCRNG